GGVTAYRDPNLREDYVRHFVFRFVPETPLDGIRARRVRLPRAEHALYQLAGTTHAGKIPEQPRSLDRVAVRRGIHRSRRSDAPLSRTAVINPSTPNNPQGEKPMHPIKKAARIAGAVYLSMVVTGPF